MREKKSQNFNCYLLLHLLQLYILFQEKQEKKQKTRNNPQKSPKWVTTDSTRKSEKILEELFSAAKTPYCLKILYLLLLAAAPLHDVILKPIGWFSRATGWLGDSVHGLS